MSHSTAAFLLFCSVAEGLHLQQLPAPASWTSPGSRCSLSEGLWGCWWPTCGTAQPLGQWGRHCPSGLHPVSPESWCAGQGTRPSLAGVAGADGAGQSQLPSAFGQGRLKRKTVEKRGGGRGLTSASPDASASQHRAAGRGRGGVVASRGAEPSPDGHGACPLHSCSPPAVLALGP